MQDYAAALRGGAQVLFQSCFRLRRGNELYIITGKGFVMNRGKEHIQYDWKRCVRSVV